MMNIDTLLNIGCALDWITPTLAFLDDWKYGPAAHFGISAFCGFDRGGIRRILNQNGIRVWGLMYNVSGDMMMFAVNEADAQAAYYALVYSGVPLDYVPVGVEI